MWTPALEYEDVLRRGDQRAAGAAYRLFDEHGEVLALRSDMTIPIARVVATRYQDAEPPFRFCYFAHAYRAVERGVGEPREFLQGGIELIGVDAPEGDAEVVALTLAALDDAGLRRHRVGVGDASLYRNLLGELDVPEERAAAAARGAGAARPRRRCELRAEQLGLPRAERDLLTRLPELRGGPEVLDRADGPVAGAVESLRALHELLAERGVAERVIFDLGLVRELGYYTGAVFEVYDPAVGFALGGGGRYDDLLGRFGRAAAGLRHLARRAARAPRAGRGGGDGR